jgi:phospholipid/cholesterol/gamma-HCH transport system substrate-binding protein
MAKPIIRDFVTGIVALGSLLGLIVMLVLFGEVANIGKRFYTFDVHVTNAGGLSGTSSVTLNGVKIGKVIETAVAAPPAFGAMLKVQVRDGVAIPRVSKISIDTRLVGDASMDFAIPTDAKPEALATMIQPGELFEGGEPSSTLNRLASAIEKPLSRFSATADNIDKLANTYTTLGERLNELLEPRTPAEVASGKPPNIRSTIARADQALAGAAKFLGDDQLVSQAKSLIQKADDVLDQASSLANSWTKTAATVDQQATKVGADMDALTAQATGTLRNTEKAAAELATILESVNKGQGTVGQLVQNPDLYNSLRDAADRLDHAIAEFQRLVEKYRTEGLRLSF